MSDPLFSCRGPTSAQLCNYAESSCNWFAMPPPPPTLTTVLRKTRFQRGSLRSQIKLLLSFCVDLIITTSNLCFCRWIPYLIQRKSWMWARGKVGPFPLCDVSHREPLTPVSGLSCTHRSSVDVFSQSVCVEVHLSSPCRRWTFGGGGGVFAPGSEWAELVNISKPEDLTKSQPVCFCGCNWSVCPFQKIPLGFHSTRAPGVLPETKG